MLLIELATQAVKGFSPSSRLALKPGYNVVVPPQGAAAGLSSLLSALLYYDGRGGDAALAAGPGAKVGLTLQGKDGRVYRLVRQLGGPGALHRLEPNNTWATVAQDSGEINQCLRGALGLPGKGQFEDLFCLRLGSFPSQHKAPARPAAPPAQASASAPAPASGERRLTQNRLVEMALASAAASRAQSGPEHMEALRQEIALGKQIEELQFKQDGLQQQIFALSDRMKKLQKIVDAADEVRKMMEPLTPPEALGIDAKARALIPAYDGAVKKLREENNKIAREKDDNRSRLARTRPLPVWKDQQFLIAAGAGAALLVLAAVLNYGFDGSAASYVGLLGIPAFGFAGLCTLRWIGELQAVESLGRKENLFKDREQKLHEEFDREYGLIKAALQKLDLDDGPELLKALQQYDECAAKLREAEARRTEANADAELAQATAEHASLTRESQDLESTIGDLGAGRTRDWREAERELAELERGEVQASGGGGAGAEGLEDPIPKLLAAGRELFAGATLEALAAAVRERAAQYLVALTDRRYQGLDIDATGQARLLASDKMVPAAALDPRDADMLYLAVKLTLLEKYAPAGKPLLVLDEPFSELEAPKLELLSRMLKHIGGQTQIVHVTANPAHRAHAAATVAA